MDTVSHVMQYLLYGVLGSPGLDPLTELTVVGDSQFITFWGKTLFTVFLVRTETIRFFGVGNMLHICRRDWSGRGLFR